MMIEMLDHNEVAAANQLSKEKKYWLKKMAGEPVKCSFPPDFIESEIYIDDKNILKFKIEDEPYRKLKKLYNGSDARLHMVLSTVLVLLVKKYCGSKDIIIGTPIYKQNTQKDFINTVLILRNQLDENNTFKDELINFRETLNDAIEHQNYPVGKILFDLGIGYTESSFPLFDIIVMLENIHQRDYITDIKVNTLFSFVRKDEYIEGMVEYNQKYYTSGTIQRIIDHFIGLLEIVLNDINIFLKDINILSEEERHELLYDFNNTHAEYPKEKTISGLFEDQVKSTPDNIALVFNKSKLTYKELNIKADRLAEKLINMGVKPDSIVGIMTEPSPEMIIGIMGILKAGGAYLPVDKDYPVDRIMYMLQDSKAEILLTRNCYLDKIVFNGRILDLEGLDLSSNDSAHFKHGSTPDNLAYVIYTSGSTGNPKGVMVLNRGLVNYIYWAKKVYLGREQLDFPLYSSISFDLTVTSIFTPLISGSKIVIYDSEDKTSLVKKIVSDNIVGILKLTPVHLSLLKNMDLSKTTIKKLILGGEDLKTKLALEINNKSEGKIEIYNEYGPTETVVGCMIHKYDIENDKRNSVPIGVPADNVMIYLLDKDLQPVSRGIEGEIFISGDGIARGYLNRPDLTKEKFIENPFIPGGKMYRTGDLARCLAGGKLEFIGRIDNQVKINGFRIEPGEVENQILTYSPVKEAAVIVKEDGNKNKFLCVYVVTSGNVTIEDLRKHLLKKLPQYMVPSHFIQIETMPLTSNGKIDRSALLEVDENMIMKTEYRAPENELEEKILAIWRNELLIKKIGINDNFFALGGNSIKALIIVEKINEELSVQIQVIDLFNKPTIKELAANLFSIDSNGYKPVMRLNDEKEKALFVFPPMAGLGIAYKDLAQFVKSHTVYSFDFIEADNRLDEYVKLITDIQPEGPYLFLAFSSGGILLFDVAKEMEKRGYEVSDILLLDCIAEKKVFSKNELDKLIEKEIGSLKEAMLLKYPLRWKYVSPSIERRIRVYLNYISSFKSNVLINTNIHQILSVHKQSELETLNSKKKWHELTTKKFEIYNGVGGHIEMLVKYLEQNMEIVTKILTKIV